jgi:hypothetical protein
MLPRPVEITKAEFVRNYDPGATAYAEAVLDWARINGFNCRNGGELCAAADIYDLQMVIEDLSV